MGAPTAIRAQLKCRASATQQQPPINKRGRRRTTSGISARKDRPRQPASQERGLLRRILSSRSSLPPLSLSPSLSLSLSCLFRSSSFFSLPFPAPDCSSSSDELALPLSFFLGFARARARARAHTHTHAGVRGCAHHGQTFCLLPLALTIKRWRRLARAAMFLIPRSVSPANPVCSPSPSPPLSPVSPLPPFGLASPWKKHVTPRSRDLIVGIIVRAAP